MINVMLIIDEKKRVLLKERKSLSRQMFLCLFQEPGEIVQ